VPGGAAAIAAGGHHGDGARRAPVILEAVAVFWFLVGLLAVLAWIIFGTQLLCPSCGLELVSSPLDRLGEDDRLDWCSHCGWKRRR